jgi:hypothetical protein
MLLSPTHLKRYSKRACLQTEDKLESEVPRSKTFDTNPPLDNNRKTTRGKQVEQGQKVQSAHTCLKAKRRAL